MGFREIFEMSAIIVVSCLMVLFAALYFMRGHKQKKLDGVAESNKLSGDTMGDWAEQVQIMHAQLDLMGELSPVFCVCYDYSRECFSISEGGRAQLGLADSAGQDQFEALIHPEDMLIYEELSEAENIRKVEAADSPYVIRLRDAQYLAQVRPVYDGGGLCSALVIAFINIEYLKK